MGGDNRILDITRPALEDLRGDRLRFVVITSNGVRRPVSENEVATGILQNAPNQGEGAAVRLIGISKLEVAEALGTGDFVGPDYVDATISGRGKSASAALAYARGYVLDGAENEGELASVLILGMVPAINDAVKHIVSPAIVNTADAHTYTPAQFLGGLILRDPAGAARNDATPAAAQIVSALPGAVAGSSFELNVRNTADAAETVTITAGAGVSLSGTMTIDQNATRRLLVVVADITEGAEAVTIYSLGAGLH